MGGLGGAGVGLGSGILTSIMADDGQENWLRNALLGTILGGSIGASGGYGYGQLQELGQAQQALSARQDEVGTFLRTYQPMLDQKKGDWLAKQIAPTE